MGSSLSYQSLLWSNSNTYDTLPKNTKILSLKSLFQHKLETPGLAYLIPPSILKILVSLALSISPFVATYIWTLVLYQVNTRKVQTVKTPPIIPHAIPCLGSALEFAYNGLKLFTFSAYALSSS